MLFTDDYMKYLYLLLLFLPLQALGQIKLQDVTISSQRPKFVRLKGYYRSYQHNDSVLKYYVDGIVEYYINLKNEKVDIRMYSSRHLRNEELVSKDKKRAFMLSDQATFRPWPEGKTFIEECRKKYAIQNSANVGYIKKASQIIGRVTTDSINKSCMIEMDMIPTYDKLTHNIFGFTQEMKSDYFMEAYRLSDEDYYSFKNLLSQKTDQSYNYWHKKDSRKQLIHVVTELFITEQEYVDGKKKEADKKLQPQEAAQSIEGFISENRLPSLPPTVQVEMKKLQFYNPSNLNKKIATSSN